MPGLVNGSWPGWGNGAEGEAGPHPDRQARGASSRPSRGFFSLRHHWPRFPRGGSMPRIAFVTDSTSYIPQDLIQKYDIKVAPQVLIWGNEQLLDGVDITPDQFYARLKTAEVMPTPSEVNAGTFKTILDPLVAQGLPVVMVLISSKLSGTINSAQHAKEMLPAGARVEIVDSEATSMALGFQGLAAARGAGVGGASKLCGTALTNKPLLELRDEREEPVEHLRTKAKALARLLDVLE